MKAFSDSIQAHQMVAVCSTCFIDLGASFLYSSINSSHLMYHGSFSLAGCSGSPSDTEKTFMNIKSSVELNPRILSFFKRIPAFVFFTKSRRCFLNFLGSEIGSSSMVVSSGFASFWSFRYLENSSIQQVTYWSLTNSLSSGFFAFKVSQKFMKLF